MSVKVLAFAGSLRKESFNKRLVKIAVQGATDAGAEVTFVDLADYPLPIFDQDLEAEQGMPENAAKLKQMFVDAAGLLIASPEYNSSLTGVLKNTLDWVSRPTGDEEPMALTAFQGKTAQIMSASPGGLGGMRGLVHLRSILSSLGTLVLPNEVSISKAGDAFADDGSLSNESKHKKVLDLGKQLAQTAAKLA